MNAKNSSHDLVDILTINPTIQLDIRYATTNNFTGKAVYPVSKCFLRKAVAQKIDSIQKELAHKGLGLKIFDGYRPLSVQRKFWEIFPDERYVANPKNGSRHNRGSAIDVTLVDLATGQELEMPSGFDDFTAKAHRDYNNMSENSKKNCQLLESYMIKYGFIPWPLEWWHFDDQDWEKYPILDIPFEQLIQIK